MPAREINPFTALTRIRSQFLRTQWSTSNHSEWIRLRIRPLSHRGWQLVYQREDIERHGTLIGLNISVYCDCIISHKADISESDASYLYTCGMKLSKTRYLASQYTHQGPVAHIIYIIWHFTGTICFILPHPCEVTLSSVTTLSPGIDWCPDQSQARDTNRFWWRLWLDNGRPRDGEVFKCYKNVKKWNDGVLGLFCAHCLG